MGLTNKPADKIATLQSLVSKYPKSVYVDDAEYEIAATYLEQGELTKSVFEFEKFLKKHKQSSLKPEALLKLGLANANLGNIR